jgi:ABC-type branched-subunit amino acid transport system substrate-binding protein
MFRTNRALVVAVSVIVPALALSACGSSSKKSSSTTTSAAAAAANGTATGTPIKLMTIAGETGPLAFPEVGLAAKAAARAINAAGGVNNHPIQIIDCDDKFNPNLTAACARKAVSEKVTAVVGALSGNGDSYMPIIAKAGIPSVADFPNSASENSSPDSFPISVSALQLTAAGAIIKSAGGSSVAYIGPNLPAYAGLMQLTGSFLSSMGVKLKNSTVFPVTATDYTQYVASAYGSGASGVVPVLAAAGTVPAFVNAVSGGGYSFAKQTTVLAGTTFSPSVLTGQLKNKLNGVYVINAGETPTDTSLPGIKQFHQEVEAAGTPLEYKDTSLGAWVGVHVIAQLLAKATGDVTQPATLIAAMKSAGPISYPGWTTFDWSKPALPGPLGKALPRAFNATFWVSKIVNNTVVSAVSAPVPFTGPIPLSTK